MAYVAEKEGASSRALCHPQRGVTLVELLVVLTIAAILLTIGVPNLRSYTERSRLDNAASELLSALQFARSEAIRRSTPVGFSSNGAAGSGNWTAGWRLFVDANRNGVFDGSDEELRVGLGLTGSLTVMATRPAYGDNLFFDSTGRVTNGGGAFIICSGTTVSRQTARVIVINASGRVRLGSDGNNDGVPETDVGNVTDCNTP